jgi:hypothetical protein
MSKSLIDDVVSASSNRRRFLKTLGLRPQGSLRSPLQEVLLHTRKLQPK